MDFQHFAKTDIYKVEFFESTKFGRGCEGVLSSLMQFSHTSFGPGSYHLDPFNPHS